MQAQFEDEGIRAVVLNYFLSQFFNNPHDNVDSSYHLLPFPWICNGAAYRGSSPHDMHLIEWGWPCVRRYSFSNSLRIKPFPSTYLSWWFYIQEQQLLRKRLSHSFESQCLFCGPRCNFSHNLLQPIKYPIVFGKLCHTTPACCP